MSFYQKTINVFLSKTVRKIVDLMNRPASYRRFDKQLPTVTIIYGSSNSTIVSLIDYVNGLAGCYNLVLFLPEGYTGLPVEERKKCWRIYYYNPKDLLKRVKQKFVWFFRSVPDIHFVLVDACIGRFLMRYLWRKKIASILLVNKNYPLKGKPLNRVLAYATRVIYDSYNTFMKTLTNELWAFPDSTDYLPFEKDERPREAEAYVREIIDICKRANKQLAQEDEDAHFLSKSPEFDIPYWTGKNKHVLNRFRYARRYIRDYKSGANAARPKPGFHPGIYAENHDLGITRIDPFVDYLKSGKPQGQWNWQVLTSPDIVHSFIGRQKIALHIHAFYPDMLGEIFQRLKNNTIRPDIFISVKSDSDKSVIEPMLKGYGDQIEIKLVPNRGRDIGPLLTEFGHKFVEDYDIIGHIHTKKSVHKTNREMVAAWNNFLLTNLLGDGKKIRMADAIVNYMQSNEKTALIFPDDKYAVGWAHNYQAAIDIAHHIGLVKLPKYVVFPTGSMFWAKAAVLKPFVDLNLTWEDYPDEPLPTDGTHLHAIERMLTLSCYQQGLDIATTYLPDTMR